MVGAVAAQTEGQHALAATKERVSRTSCLMCALSSVFREGRAALTMGRSQRRVGQGDRSMMSVAGRGFHERRVARVSSSIACRSGARSASLVTASGRSRLLRITLRKKCSTAQPSPTLISPCALTRPRRMPGKRQKRSLAHCGSISSNSQIALNELAALECSSKIQVSASR